MKNKKTTEAHTCTRATFLRAQSNGEGGGGPAALPVIERTKAKDKMRNKN